MAVPGASANYLVNTTGGAFSAQTQGGTLLGNGVSSTPASPVANAFTLLDAAPLVHPDSLKPVTGAATNPWGQKVVSGSTGGFAYQAAGTYSIMASTNTIAGDTSTKILIPGAASVLGRQAIAQFKHDFGADTTSLMREGRYARTGYMPDGNKLAKRSANRWFNAGGTAYAVPTTLTAQLPWAPGGSARNGSGAFAAVTDSAANPTFAIPGRLAMKRTWVTTNLNVWTATDGNQFTYKAINGA